MEDTSDLYKTINHASEKVFFKEKKSKFYGYAFPIAVEDDVKPIIETIKKEHPSAGHVCYAWQLGVNNIRYRTNDDGEPNNSAGAPIYGQIQSFGVTNILVTVARIFGGTKLGVGGLIGAYRTGAKIALESSKIIEMTLQQEFLLTFAYAEMDIVMRTIKQKKLKIVQQNLEMDCKLTISVRKRDVKKIENIFKGIYGISLKKKKTK